MSKVIFYYKLDTVMKIHMNAIWLNNKINLFLNKLSNFSYDLDYLNLLLLF